MGIGAALAARLQNSKRRIFVLLSDAECDEGSLWEAAMFASHHKLDNLIAIIDHNKLQSLGQIDDIVSLEPFADKWRAFGWEVREINGHNLSEIIDALEGVPFSKNKPGVLIGHTIKGKGISFMENVSIWHYRLPNADEMKIACANLDIDTDELGKVLK